VLIFGIRERAFGSNAIAVAQAGNGAAYLQQIISQEAQTYATRRLNALSRRR